MAPSLNTYEKPKDWILIVHCCTTVSNLDKEQDYYSLLTTFHWETTVVVVRAFAPESDTPKLLYSLQYKPLKKGEERTESFCRYYD